MIRAIKLFAPWPIWLLWGGDLLMAATAIVAGLAVSYAVLPQILEFSGRYNLQILVFVIPVSLFLFIFGAYSKRAVANFKVSLASITISHFAVFCFLAGFFYFFPAFRIWISAMLPGLFFSIILITLTHFVFDRFVALRFLRRRIIVLGQGTAADRIEALGRAKCFPMVEFVGIFRVDAEKFKGDQIFLELESALIDSVEEVVLAFDDRRNSLPVDQLLAVRMRGVDISYISTFLEREQGRVDIDALQPSWMIFSTGFSAGQRFERFFKRVFDLLTSAIILVLAAPLILFSAAAVMLQDLGAPFYTQRRIGLNGVPFCIYKLRTMRRDSEEDGTAKWSEPGDQRVTWIGKFLRRTRIDELPQLINVLQGHMSLIGPRPEQPSLVADLKRQIPYYDFRHVVKPGISGWAQLHYPYGATVEDAKEKLAYDLFYIKNYSWMLDLVILLQTLRVVVWPPKQELAGSYEALRGNSLSRSD